MGCVRSGLHNFAHLDGPVGFEFWPPSKFWLSPVLVKDGDGYAIATHRQYASYEATTGEELSTVAADITPVRAESYKSVTFLVSRRGAQPWSAMMSTDIERLGKPTSMIARTFQGRSGRRAVLDRSGNGVLIESKDGWHIHTETESRKLELPGEFDPLAMDLGEGM